MTILTASTTFPVGDSSVETTSIPILILPIAETGEGTGRLIHPTLGTYDYPYCPDEWLNFDSDIIIPPVWSNSRTLNGAANLLFAGHIRDIEVEERWNSDLGGPLDFVRMLCNMWMNPPDPDVGYVQWFPNYATEFGYNVIMLGVRVGGADGIQLNYVTRQLDNNNSRWVEGDVVLRMRIVEKL